MLTFDIATAVTPHCVCCQLIDVYWFIVFYGAAPQCYQCQFCLHYDFLFFSICKLAKAVPSFHCAALWCWQTDAPHWCHQLIVVIDIFFLSMLMLPPVLLHNFLLLRLHRYHCHCSQWCTIMLLIAIRPLVCHSYCHHLPCHAMMLLSMMLPDFSASFSSFAESAVKLVPSPLVYSSSRLRTWIHMAIMLNSQMT